MEPAIAEMGHMVKRLQVRHHRAANQALAELGVSMVQWDALRHIHENPGASLHDLAQLTFESDQGFGALVARMEGRGFIERAPGPGRAVRHRLTAEGDRVRVAGAQLVVEVLKTSFSALSPAQLATFDKLLRRLVPGPGARS
jgi:DNA-binding MarR family transcriptional regulator